MKANPVGDCAIRASSIAESHAAAPGRGGGTNSADTGSGADVAALIVPASLR